MAAQHRPLRCFALLAVACVCLLPLLALCTPPRSTDERPLPGTAPVVTPRPPLQRQGQAEAPLPVRPRPGARPADCALLRGFDMERRSQAVPRDPAELALVLAHLYCGVPLSFIRYGDGELMLVRARPSWPRQPTGIEHYAALGCFDWIDRHGNTGGGRFSPYVRLPTRYLSSATVFINENYAAFKGELARWSRAFTRETSPFVLVANVAALGPSGTAAPPWVRDAVALPDEGPRLWEELRPVLLSQFTALARAHSGRVFLLSAGPLAKALAYHMARASANNSYIDVGSATDELLKGTTTGRPYQSGRRERPCRMYARDAATGLIHYVE
eukprot:m51a1_g5884 hypothetical protein (329) ;mRNA; f:516308-518039